MSLSIEALLKRLGIEAKKFGVHWVAQCPSGEHDDNNPSWRIRDESGTRRGLHHCQACKFGGDLIELVKHVKNYGTREGAKGWLEKAGEDYTVEDLRQPAVRLAVQSVNPRTFKLPVGVEFKTLEAWPSLPRRYLETERKVDDHTVRRWGIGYAILGRLSGRIVVPVKDRREKIVSYMARTFVGATRRYLYPHEVEGADHDVMFGEMWWVDPERPIVVVTEGAFKSMAVDRCMQGIFHKEHVANAAIGGSGIRPMHVAKLATFKKVVVFTDNDDPGNKAAADLIAALAGHAETVRVRLEPGQDPDSVEPGVLAEALRPAWNWDNSQR